MSNEDKCQVLLHKEGSTLVKTYELCCVPEQTVYQAASDKGFRLPASCLNGVCHVCRATLLSGKVLTGASRQLVDADSMAGYAEIMLCKTWALSDCAISLKNIYGPGELPLKNSMCQVVNVGCLKGYVFQVDLSFPAGKQPEFFAGQYLSLNLPGKSEPSFFSIASAPGGRIFSLHIQADPHLLSAVEVVEYLQVCYQQNTPVSISLPFGEACLHTFPEQPLVLIAAGTGFAQMKSILEFLFAGECSQSVALYWGVRKPEDMYLHALAEQWAAQFTNFTFRPLIVDLEENDAVHHHNLLSDAVLAEQKNLIEAQVYVSGSPKLVFSVMDALLEAGLPASQFHSDVLAYAVRD